jgi:hypothetical protein
MAASYESFRRDRLYEIDSLGITEFGPDGAPRQFIPWENVKRIDFTHDPPRQLVHWSVRAADGRRITPELGYTSSLECYTAAVRAWRELMPEAVRAQFARRYRQFQWALALTHLLWIIPALFLGAAMGFFYWGGAPIPWDEINNISRCTALLYVLCVLWTLLYRKELRLGFDGWYALMESRLTEPPSASAPATSFSILRWLFPALPAFAEEPITDLERHIYKRWSNGSLLATLLLVALLTYEWYLALTWAASLFHHEVRGTRFSVQPPATYWLVPASLFALFTSAMLLDGVYRVLLRDRYRRYQRYELERIGFDPRRLLACYAVISVAGSAVLFVAGVTSFTRFTDDGIEIQRPLSFRSDFYSYARVRAIEHRAIDRTPIGITFKRPHHVILFDVGNSWDSSSGLRDPVPDVDGRIARLVSQRSKRPIIEQP